MMTDPETPTVERQVNRYFITGSGYIVGDNALGNVSVDLVPSPQGEWVRHADYLTLQAECQRLREENAQIDRSRKSESRRADSAEGIVRLLEADLARLRADKEQENACEHNRMVPIPHFPGEPRIGFACYDCSEWFLVDPPQQKET